MKKCNFCGTLIEDDSLFCSYCGKKIEQKAKTCPRCGAELEDESIFCSKCGLKLQITPEETLHQEAEIQKFDNHSSKSKYLKYAFIGIVALSIISAFCTYKYFNNPSHDETIKYIFNKNNNKTEIKDLMLIGDADGFPLKLGLHIVNEDVTGLYKNITYGTSMTVKGRIVDDVIQLEGAADGTTYTFIIIQKGEDYTGTFGTIGGKRLNLHLRNCPDAMNVENEQ